jgi:hypothetical protein
LLCIVAFERWDSLHCSRIPRFFFKKIHVVHL